ncbi:MAG: alpha/beta hydrolase [Pseudomonadota bacterium]
MLGSCAPEVELGKRHAPSNLTTPVPIADFDGYVLAAQQYVAAANQMADEALAATVVEDRGPFELEAKGRGCRTDAGPARQAALLIHDLGDTPYVLRDLGERLARACYLVRAILLPGHGGVPGDLLAVDVNEWRDAVRLGVASMADVADEITVVGFGLGGSLALDLVMSEAGEGQEVASLVLLAPAIGEPTSNFERQAQLFYNALAPSGGWSGIGAASAWPAVFADDDPVRYESLPSNAWQQRERVILELAGREGDVDLPVFMALSEDDVTVDAHAARRWFCSRATGARKLLWYTTAVGELTGCPSIIERDVGPTGEVLDLSHIALPVAPDNPRYGRGSGYRSCLHYYWEKDTPSWFFCSDPARSPGNSEVRYGEITEANLDAHVMRRLTYNPDFDGLASDILDFLGGAR